MVTDPAKPGQSLELLLPMLLQAALTGKQLGPAQLMAVLATGKPVTTAPTPQPNTVPAPVMQAQPQAPQPPLPGIRQRRTVAAKEMIRHH